MTWFNDTGGLRAARLETRDAPRSLGFAISTVCAIDPAGPALESLMEKAREIASGPLSDFRSDCVGQLRPIQHRRSLQKLKQEADFCSFGAAR